MSPRRAALQALFRRRITGPGPASSLGPQELPPDSAPLQLLRFYKCIKRDRLQDLQLLLESGAQGGGAAGVTCRQ